MTRAAGQRDLPSVSPRAVLSCGGLLIGTLLVFWLWQLTRTTATSWGEVQYRELAALHQSGTPLWTPPGGYPHVLNPYGPVYLTLISLTPADSPGFYLAGRLLSMVALAVVATLLLRATDGSTSRAWRPAVAIALLTSRTFVGYGCQMVVDPFMLALTTAGLMLAWRGRGGATALLAGGLCGLALGVKATAAAAPIAALWWLARTDRRRAGGFAGGLLIVAGGLLLAAQSASGGAYLANLLRPATDLDRGAEVLSRLVFTTGPLMLALYFAWSWLAPDDRRTLRPLQVWFWSSLALLAVVACNWGAGWNYLFETLTAAAFCLAAAGERLTAKRRRRLATLLLVQLTISSVTLARLAVDTGETTREQAAAGDRAEPLLRAAIARGERGLVSANPGAADRWLALGQVNPLDLVGPGEEAELSRAEQALRDGLLEIVVVGDPPRVIRR